MQLKDKILNEKIKFPYLQRMKNSSNYLLKKELEKHKTNKSLKLFFPEVPDVGRYNPQYNTLIDIYIEHFLEICQLIDFIPLNMK